MERRKFDYSSTQVNLPDDLAKQVMAWGYKHIPESYLYKVGPEYGREPEPHITILYGMQETNVQKIKHALLDQSPFKVKLKKINTFETPNFDVVKIEVESDVLFHLNELFKSKFDHKCMHPEYSPHVTIAYLKKNKYKNIDDNPFDGTEFNVRHIAFSSKNGGRSNIALKGRL